MFLILHQTRSHCGQFVAVFYCCKMKVKVACNNVLKVFCRCVLLFVTGAALTGADSHELQEVLEETNVRNTISNLHISRFVAYIH